MKRIKTSTIVLIVIAVLVVLIGIFFFTSYNGLATSLQTVEKSQSDIQSQLQRRADLIPNLVNTVKGYASHETEVFSDVTEARSKLMGANTVSEMDDAQAQMNSALSRLLLIVENYPDLKANANYQALQDELAGTENRINTARTRYNEAAQSYNNRIVRFPTNLIAGLFGFDKVDYFQASAGSEQVPTVSFE